MRYISLLITAACCLISGRPAAQTAVQITNPVAEQILLGQYNPAAYLPPVVLNHPDTISRGIAARISPDSLHAYLEVLRTFGNRNTGADTVSAATGIGAARRWVYRKFAQFGAGSGNRLIPSYLQFNQVICGQPQHRNIFAVLPGTDTTDKSVVLVEAHIDSRCEGVCDTACLAEGMEDNGSGTALVLELARVMSRYSYPHTIVFLIVIGEEQGLYGAEAFAGYAKQKNIKIKAVVNNDVVGGILCGQTASPPGCTGLNSVDSTNVRLFSLGGFNSPHKGLARFVKLEYQEMIRPVTAVPMGIHIMSEEDRGGRGGDHIPFRQYGYSAIRLTAANEHGDANVANPAYEDRQHTSDDILGLDTDNDQVLDSFFVDFNYLARNAVINGNAAGMAAIGPKTPDLTLTGGIGSLTVQITQQTQYQQYRIGLRTTSHDWDSVYTVSGTGPHTILVPAGGPYIVSAASVDDKGVESLFSRELMSSVSVPETEAGGSGVELLQNKPNPFDEATIIGVRVHGDAVWQEAFIIITDAATGREVSRLPVTLRKGVNEVVYRHGYNQTGTFVYTLVAGGRQIASRKMVFAN